jgi:tRNA (guanine26-N2/guanine27-N2)-dimethyltransferase
MIVYNCDSGCGAWKTQLLVRNRPTTNKRGTGIFYKHTFSAAPTADQHCEHCGFKMHLAGPMYAGRLHSREFIQDILDGLSEVPKDVYGTTERIKGMLTTALEEYLEAPPEKVPHAEEPLEEDPTAAIDPYPFFFGSQQIARSLHCATPSENALRGALRHLGYRVTRSHCKPGSIKTDAPWSVIWHIMKEWIRQKAPVKTENIKQGTAAYGLLKLGEEALEAKSAASKEEDAQEVIFDEQLGREENKEKLVRYQMNPRKDWGPMNRARGK